MCKYDGEWYDGGPVLYREAKEVRMDIDAAVEEAFRDIHAPKDRENFAIHLLVLTQIKSDRFVGGEGGPVRKLQTAGLLIPELGRPNFFRASDELIAWLGARKWSISLGTFEKK